jgi:serine/threonine protein kinase
LVDVFEDTDNSYLIMELCDSDIYQLIKKAQFNESQIRFYGKQLAEGLQYMHSLNIIHRDIKLGNLLI